MFNCYLMENYDSIVVEGLASPLTFKVHFRMCSELVKLVVRVSKIIPEIEAARPRSSGIESLCSLNTAIEKVKSVLRCCSESSILYSVLDGDNIVARCYKLRDLLEHGLSRIQHMVPLVLAAQISGIVVALRSASFCLYLPEEEAGNLLRELIHRYGSSFDSKEEFTISSIHAVCSWLHISSQKALENEKRSIRKLLDKYGDTYPRKKKILSFCHRLLNKYGNIVIKDQEKWFERQV